MQFLAPLFLAGLVAVAVPLILHLIQRERREATSFPSLMFVQRIPHRSTRRRRLRDLPLLLLRVLALVLLAGAFARPWLRREAPTAAVGGGARDVVLLVDRSYSMGRVWSRAVDAALAEVDRLAQGDRLSIVAFDENAAVLAQPTGDRGRLRSLLRELRPGWGTTRYDPALRLAANILESSRLPRREVVLVSDYQRGGLGDGLEAKLPAGVQLRGVPLATPLAANLAVAAVTFEREVFEGQERITPVARIVNTADSAVRNASVRLELDGRALPVVPVSAGGHSAITVRLPRFTLTVPVRGTVSVTPDALTADDVQHFALAPGQSIAVEARSPRAGDLLFLQRALEVGGEPGFRVRTGGSGVPSIARGVVVLADANASASELRAFVENGGGLVVAAGPNASSFGSLAALLPATPGQVVDRTASGGGTLSQVELEHPVFELFRAPRSGDLTSPRFYRYRPLQLASGQDSSVRVLARFDDGSIALAERRVGLGRVLVWGSTLDRAWNDLPVQPVFVPFVHQLMKYASGYSRPLAARTVGEVADARALAAVPEDEALVVIGPDGTRRELAGGQHGMALEQRGFYAVRRRGDAAASLATIAANVDVRESDLAALEPRTLAAAVQLEAEAPRRSIVSTLTPVEREREQNLWWYALVATLLLLGVETALSNRRARAARVREVR